MTIIYVLLVAHFVADFVCQSDWMAVNKAKDWGALALHVAVYGSAMSVVVAVGLILADYDPGRPMQMTLTAWLLVNMVAHFVQDAITSRITSRLWFLKLTLAGRNWRVRYDDARSGTSTTSTNQEVFWSDDTGTRHWFFVAIGADQLLHYVTLFVTAGWWLR